MKESEFISECKKKWIEAEKILKKDKPDPESMYKLFINVSDNLSYARTKYRNRQVRIYLNDLAQNLFVFLYRNRSVNKMTVVDFWTKKLPLTIYKCRRELLVSLIIFSLAIAVGIFSALNDPHFAREILGDQYINATLDNIEKGDPMGIYKDAGSGKMFLSITINNILVSFRVFIMGLFAGIGSAIMLIYNGIMLGTFQYFFIERGLTWISFITIWQHGIIEISSIVIAGGAGIVMGKGLMFPGSYSRSVSLRKSASKAISIITGLIPLFIIAGFIESFVTRQTELPDFIKILSLLLSASLILGYFYYYPRKVAKMTYSGLSDIDEITINDKPVDLNKSYSGIQTVNNVLRFAKINFESIISLSFFLAVVYGVVGIILYLTGSIPLTTNSLLSAHDYNKFPSYIITSVFIYTILFSRLYFLIKVKCISDLQVEKRFWTFFKKHWLKLFVISSLLNTPLFIKSGWGDLLYLTNIIIFTPSAISVMNGKRSLYKDVVSGFKLIFNHFGRYLTPVLILILLFIASYGCIMALDSFFKSTSGWGLEGFSVFVPAGKIFLEFFIDEIFTLIFSSLLFTSLVFGWHSINEIDNASDLIRRIENISTVKKYKFEK